ncbi:pilin [Streptomyces noursei]|uniref:pilin n=1 Tax=Streptomyces noursei TaxID=1971 RepID=UPI0038053395
MLARFRRPHRRLNRPKARWVTRFAFVTAGVALLLLASSPRVWAVTDIPTVIKNLRNWVVGLLSGLATLFLTFGGLRYLMAGATRVKSTPQSGP